MLKLLNYSIYSYIQYVPVHFKAMIMIIDDDNTIIMIIDDNIIIMIINNNSWLVLPSIIKSSV